MRRDAAREGGEAVSEEEVKEAATEREAAVRKLQLR
jgi:hypothetical protein